MDQFKIIYTLADKHIPQLLELYREEWWTKTRTEQDVRKALHHSAYVFGVTDLTEEVLYGFARVLSDQVYFGLIFDVIVHKDHRKKGIGSFILETIKNHSVISKMEYLELCCKKELMPFYEKQGFKLGDGRMNIVKPKNPPS